MEGVNAQLSLYQEGGESAEITLPRFDLVAGENKGSSVGAGTINRGVPVRKVTGTW